MSFGGRRNYQLENLTIFNDWRNDEYTYAYNHLLDCYITNTKEDPINEIMLEYAKSPNDRLLPFQNDDMRRSNSIRYGLTSEMKQYKKSKDDLLDKLGTMKYDDLFRITAIDFYKMMDRSESFYMYIYQMDPHLLDHLRTCVRPVMDSIDTNSRESDVIFIPDVQNINPSNCFKLADNGHHITIVEPQRTQEKLDEIGKNLFNDNKTRLSSYDVVRGIIYHQFFNIMEKYENISTRVTLLQDIKRDIYNITEEDLTKFFAKRNEMFLRYKTMPSQPNCKLLLNEYFAKYPFTYPIEQNTKTFLEKLNKCIFDESFANDLHYPLQQSNLDNCTYFYSSAGQQLLHAKTEKCGSIVQQLKEEISKKTPNIKQYIEPTLNTISSLVSPIQPTRQLSDFFLPTPSEQSAKSIDPLFDLLPEYSPEWTYHCKFGNIVEMNKHKQLLLGKHSITKYLEFCSFLFDSNPFIDTTVSFSIETLTWSLQVNKVATACKLASTDTFPVRFLIPVKNGLLASSRYSVFNSQTPKQFIGTLMFKVFDPIINKNSYYCLHMYAEYDIEMNELAISLYNFRGNVVIPGTPNEFIRVLHQELNSVLYNSDTKLTTAPLYKYLHKSYKQTLNLFVSKYTQTQIQDNLLRIMDAQTFRELWSNLEQVEIVKDYNGRFKIIPYPIINTMNTKQTGGGSIFTKHIEYEYKIPYFDSKVFPQNIYETYSNYESYVSKFRTHTLYYIVNPFQFLATNDLYSKQSIVYDAIFPPKEKQHQYVQIVKRLMKTPIIAYKFSDLTSFMFAKTIHTKQLIDKTSSVFIVAKNSFALDSVNYVIKYLLAGNTNLIDFYFYEYQNSPHNIDAVNSYVTKNSIKKTSITQPLNNTTVAKLAHKEYDVAICDLIHQYFCDINKELPCSYAINRNLYSIIPGIIMSISQLKKGGTFILYADLFTKTYMVDVIAYVAQNFGGLLFETTDQFVETPMIMYIFKDYDGKMNLDVFKELNDLNYQNDPKGGFGQANKSLRQIFDTTGLEPFYEKYKKLITDFINKQLVTFHEVEQVVAKQSDTSFLQQILKKNIVNAIKLIKETGFEIPEWVDNSLIYENTALTMFKEKPIDGLIRLKFDDTPTIKPSSKTTIEHDFTKSVVLSESIYQYLDTHNYKKYKNIEQSINNIQKQLNKTLFEKYNININGQYVSRAWLKLYGMLHKTELLRNCAGQKKLSVFHICEAPGNYISALDYFVKHNTDIKEFDWHAQTLKDADIGDEYGFIKANKERWDWGVAGTGDVTDSKNIHGYFEKYEGVDGVIGDCGTSWKYGETGPNLGYYQLLYALLFPRKDGFFVYKTYLSNFDPFYMAGLYVVLSKYKEVMFYKSNINFWSPEIYFVGIGFLGTTPSEKKQIFDCIEHHKYLVPEVPKPFCEKFEALVNSLISEHIQSKKMLVFVSENEEYYQRTYPKIVKLLMEKNIKFAQKYFAHLQNMNQLVKALTKK